MVQEPGLPVDTAGVPGEGPAGSNDATLVKRPGLPDDVAATVLFLASDLAGFITGEVIDVNGGAYFS